jgi:hypothetical protein
MIEANLVSDEAYSSCVEGSVLTTQCPKDIVGLFIKAAKQVGLGMTVFGPGQSLNSLDRVPKGCVGISVNIPDSEKLDAFFSAVKTFKNSEDKEDGIIPIIMPERQAQTVAKYYLKKWESGGETIATVFQNGNIGFGQHIEDAGFSATFFPCPPASLNLEKDWTELTPEQVNTYRRPKTP